MIGLESGRIRRALQGHGTSSTLHLEPVHPWLASGMLDVSESEAHCKSARHSEHIASRACTPVAGMLNERLGRVRKVK